MIGKKINQLATELAPVSTDLTIIGDPDSGVSKKITLAQLGAIFSGAVSFYTDLASFPATGDINVIYCAKDTKKLYLWSGTAYVEVFPSQALLDTYQLRSEKGNANGYASLDSGGKVPISQLPSSIMEYKGTWNAATNTPTLANGTGDTGDVYICNVAGTVDFGAGPLTFAVGDYVIYSGTIWQRSSGAVGTVTSVAVSRSGDALAITGSPVTTSGTINIGFSGTSSEYINGAGNRITFPTLLSSVGLSMPSAFNVANSPLTANGTIAVTGAGNATQYVRGDGQLATLPTNGGGGGASVSYYLNGSINQGTISGVTYYEMNKTPIIGAGTDFTRNSNGYIASFLTDANDPALLNIPAGNFNFETYFEASSGGGSPTFYIELYKYDGTTFTLIASNSGSPKLINDGTNIEAYFSALAVPQTTLTLTDRLAVRIYVTTAGRTITLHTENGHLCQVVTTFTTGLTALNGLTEQVQYFATGTSGSDFNIASATATHTFNLPTASATNRGALSSADWSTFNAKQNALNGTGFVKISGTTISYDNSTYYLASNPNAYIALTALSAGAGISYNNTTGVIASTITQYTDALARAAISLTTTGTSGAATYNSTTGVLNIPQYADQFVGTVTSVAALTIGTTGTDLSSTVANSTTTPVITLNVPTASATNRGALSSADWTTFNNKQNALTNPVTGTGTTNYLPKFTGASTIGNSLVFDNGTNVGINQTTLFVKFSVVDSLAATSVGSNFNAGIVNIQNTNTTNGNLSLIGFQDASAFINLAAFGAINEVHSASPNNVKGSLAFYTKNSGTSYVTEKMRLNANGELCVGRTSAYGAGFLVNVEGNIYASAAIVAGSTITAASNITITNAARPYFIALTTNANEEAGIKIQQSTVSDWYIGTAQGSPSAQDLAIRDVKNGRIPLYFAASTGAATFSGNLNVTVANTPEVFLTHSNTSRTFLMAVDGSNAFFRANSTNNILFQVAGGTNVMALTSGGNVGIGMIATDYKLDINSTSTYKTLMLRANAVGTRFDTALEFNAINVRTGPYARIGLQISSATSGDETGGLTFWTINNGTFSEKMAITSGGNLEIATGSIKTGEPDTGWGRSAIKIGASVSGLAFNVTRYLPVSVDGTVYYINLNSSTP
jgi:hypothetical protein